jgi:hypothetical protein
MDNEQGYAEAYREVIHEDRMKIVSATKAPDYSFRLAGGKRFFFVEAKKPGVSVKDEIQPAYQIRRYGWSDNRVIIGHVTLLKILWEIFIDILSVGNDNKSNCIIINYFNTNAVVPNSYSVII